MNLNKIDLNDKKDQAFQTTKDIVIPAGTVLENWSNEQKEDSNRFEMIFGTNSQTVITLKLYPSDLEEIIKNDDELFIIKND